MPKPKPVPTSKKYPPLDILKGCILQRKLAMGLTYEDLADVANTSPNYIRHMMKEKMSNEWNKEMLNSICELLGLKVQLKMYDLNDLNEEGFK